MIIRLLLLCIITALLPVDKATSEMLVASLVAIGMTGITMLADYVVCLSNRAKLLLFLCLATAGMQYFAPVLFLMQEEPYLPMWETSIMMPMLPVLLLFWLHIARYCYRSTPFVALAPPVAVVAPVVESENSKNQYNEIPSLYVIKAERFALVGS
jgi:hypothetical protein